MSWLFPSGGQSIGASASVLPMNIQNWFPLGLTGLISLESIKSLLQHHSSKLSVLRRSVFFLTELSHPHMTAGKMIALTMWTFVGKVMSLLFNMLSRFVRAFLPRSRGLFISWLQLPSAVILEPKKIKSVIASTLPPLLFAMKWQDQILSFLNVEFQASFFTLLFYPIKRLFSSSSLVPYH